MHSRFCGCEALALPLSEEGIAKKRKLTMKERIRIKLMAMLLALIACQLEAFAYDRPSKDTDANVYGHVIDKGSGNHLPYIIVAVKGTTIGTSTDATGHFFPEKPSCREADNRG